MGVMLLLAAAATNDVTTITNEVLDRGVIGLLSAAVILLIVAGFRGWYLWKPTVDVLITLKDQQIRDLTDDRDYYREFAMRTLNVGEALASRRRTES